ncbi:excinuclease [Pseudomonas sp. GV071]|jgi:uncharacterized protein YbjQ (UPF0145 family)|uniref:excinuclease n=1 Tax=Pseudomonas sp. GV071 TaxID=2135754 RepID=UPI000D37C65B|nr:excinuclease [Pseudomonas sp. GV071]PTQ68665.1 hypothetical protein C8K61_11031 [Pseudomonas sp. GV071]
MHLKSLTAAALLLAAIPGISQARDTTHYLPLETVIAQATAAGKLDGSVKFYMAGKKPAGKVTVINPQITTSQKTNAFNKTDEVACAWAMQSAVIKLANAAKAAGANAVIEIASNYKGVEYKNPENYECHAGAIMAGVALKAQLASVK